MTNKKNLPLLIFDLDGTLIDSAADIHIALNLVLKKYNRAQVSLPTLITHIGDGLIKLVNDFFPEFELDSPELENLVNEFLDLYRDDYLTNHTSLYPGVYEFLSTYEGPKALVTNKNIHPTRRIFEHFKLDQLPWIDIIGGDSLPERKPSALPLLTVMQKIGYAPENTWMIGDGRPDMKSAIAAGCKKAAVHYGYSREDELAPYKPDLILQTFLDVKKLLG
ncbi:HAD family hydrolase [Pseudobdellovibrio exovorus]|uniref:phosphoglycolate phosphatase n=1 Tax=Pseudobdellovibrio exovorus JSS TaxID=1184267 RepID=M4VB46_9BACT|nr:HAD hydrolase-like protein [Pseudobdellovibrio exovorus]AGH96438.1 phosphoglycolate phosphatase [Pseudobdellovibrio exovorus JSS]